MIEVTVHSVRVSLITQHRVVVLMEVDGERYLPIWIGSNEADAIALRLQGVEMARPFTHDLLCSVIESLGGKVGRVLVNEIRDNTFYARIVFDVDGRYAEVDSRPSDAIALAVRVNCPIFVAETVLEQAGLTLSEEDLTEQAAAEDGRGPGLDVFRDFLEQLDLGDEPEEPPEETS
jgi:bifunctional DNase/RNase